MDKPKLNYLANAVKENFNENLPQFLTGAGIAFMLIGTVNAVKNAEKAKQALNEAVKQKGVKSEEELTKMEKVKTVAPVYSSAILFSTTGIILLIGSNFISMKRCASMTAAYTMTNEVLKRYRSAVVETVGEKKEKQIRSKSVEKEAEAAGSSNVVIVGNGDTLCVDEWSGIPFNSSIDKIRNAIVNINDDFTKGTEYYHSLNHLYSLLGIETTRGGETLGWNFDRDGTLEVNFDAKITKDGKPYIVMMIDPAPAPDFERLIY